jgi:hypothetical protein
LRKKILALALALTLALGLSTLILGIYMIYMPAQLRRKVKALTNSVRTLAAENARLRTPRARVYKLSHRARTFYTLYLRKIMSSTRVYKQPIHDKRRQLYCLDYEAILAFSVWKEPNSKPIINEYRGERGEEDNRSRFQSLYTSGL